MGIKDGGPAFPIKLDCNTTALGMSLRDYFAVEALPIARSCLVIPKNKTDYVIDTQTIADIAYAFADAMLAARTKE